MPEIDVGLINYHDPPTPPANIVNKSQVMAETDIVENDEDGAKLPPKAQNAGPDN